MNYLLFDDKSWENLLPLTYTRPAAEIRIGIMTLREKWENQLKTSCSWLTREYLQEKYPLRIESDNVLINSTVLPDSELLHAIGKLVPGEALIAQNIMIAAHLSSERVKNFKYQESNSYVQKEFAAAITKIWHPWDIFSKNGKALTDDFQILTKGRKSAHISSTNRVLLPENVFLEPGARMEFVTLNASTGPIYIGKDAEIMENSVIRGPFALCEGAVVKMAAKIYGPTTFGPYCKVGGECNNVVLFANSNKAHDGFLGNAVLGEWCNLGADTNNSNLKNNYAEVKVWSFIEDRFVKTGLQFCGLIMGDHSKSGINTMFNTGTVVGVSANIFGSGFPRNMIPSFSWGGSALMTEYKLETVFEVAERVMERRGQSLTDVDKRLMIHIFNLTKKYRNY